jgi:hypothetical protein
MREIPAGAAADFEHAVAVAQRHAVDRFSA